MSKKTSLSILEATEKLSEATIDEYCQYLYEEAEGDVDGIPDYETVLNYFFYVTKREYNLLYKRVKLAIENVADHFYNGKIELSNRATINRLYGNIDDVDPEETMWTYSDLVRNALESFEKETGVEVWQDGRMGRHIVVDDNFSNAYNYNKLCEVQEGWEDWVVEEFAKQYPFPEDTKKEEV